MKNKKYIYLYGILAILIVMLIGVAIRNSFPLHDQQNNGNSFVLQENNDELDEAKEKPATETWDITDSVVRISVGEHGATGLIWRITDEDIVIITNKHVLVNGDRIEVSLQPDISIEADYLGVSSEYDVGFCRIPIEKQQLDEDDKMTYMSEYIQEYLTRVSQNRERYEVHICEDEEAWKQETFLGLNVQHVGMDIRGNTGIQVYDGYISGYGFIPEFYEEMLITTGYSEGGMSGGGVFSEEGILLGLLSGGALEQEQNTKETNTTYSIPTECLKEAYEEVLTILINS